MIDLSDVTLDGVDTMTAQDVLALRNVIIKDGSANAGANMLARRLVEGLALPDHVLVVTVRSVDTTSTDGESN